MFGKEYECKDCGRAFLVREEERKTLACPGCESENVALKPPRPLPDWIIRNRNAGCSGCN